LDERQKYINSFDKYVPVGTDMVTELEKNKMCADALHLWGIYPQMLMGIEEAAELILGICKFNRGQKTAADITDELADNRIMAYQTMRILGISEEEVTAREEFKWNRLQERINADKEKKRVGEKNDTN
jgi:hypothetical protein